MVGRRALDAETGVRPSAREQIPSDVAVADRALDPGAPVRTGPRERKPKTKKVLRRPRMKFCECGQPVYGFSHLGGKVGELICKRCYYREHGREWPPLGCSPRDSNPDLQG